MANNKIAYGLAKENGIDTTGMIPKEVWKALKDKGINSKEIERAQSESEAGARSSLEKKFIHDGGTQSNYTPELKRLLGEEFKGYKGQDAVDKLLKEKRGHVKGAFHRDDIGDIDLFWGSDTVGLQHIIKQRNKEKKNYSKEEQRKHTMRVVNVLSDAVQFGTFLKKNSRGDIIYKYERIKIVVAKEYHNNKITYILTAYEK